MKKALVILPLLLAACAVGPDYQRPDVSLSDRFIGANAAAVADVAQQRWWQDYNDPLLSTLVEQGLSQSLDVLTAIERIQQARANAKATGLSAAVSGSLDVANVRQGGDAIDGVQVIDSQQLSAALVVDLFGRVQRGREAALADLVAAKAESQTVRLAWLAELVSAYADARYYQAVKKLAENTIAAREQTAAIIRLQFEAGASTQFEVATAEALLATAKADVPRYQALFSANVFSIATLLNTSATEVFAQMEAPSEQLETPAIYELGVPADLLRNRPDVRSAEADLAAAVANVGVAQAALYPAISLSGTVGASDGLESWTFGPQLSLPIFNQVALRANRDAAESIAAQAELQWRAAVLKAVEDVQIGQSNLEHYTARSTALQQAAESYQQALAMAQENFRAGAITLLDLLDTDRNALAASLSAASAINDNAKAWAVLKIAIGAGAGE
ncbi:efflux transporter outer membrane subunit [Spongiibacter sp. KMU-158]|uniref:Efflux transporter outer membrane subunit n=1 Tax=Spongiibacter pelagi TaxID=2760804 RepID=A0A927GWY5_9GAMM|nr:efflux transporter outer membrane subunit [Spongiibacter pelagi]MBD2859427.1 efflux transporter outer membrane subunit [Spongiibacter pelagi]